MVENASVETACIQARKEVDARGTRRASAPAVLAAYLARIVPKKKVDGCSLCYFLLWRVVAEKRLLLGDARCLHNGSISAKQQET